ncbi:MAG: response regulator [Candidatus Omnitrophota bacterium]
MAGKKILIVDDDAKMLRLLSDILSNEGFEVTTANNGNDGVRLAVEKIPDLIILDVMMPDKDGGQVGRELMENIKTKNIPLIFLSSLITEDDAGETGGKIAGVLYLSKSMNKKEFVKKIKEVLNK